MRISDWSSDVCSSDLGGEYLVHRQAAQRDTGIGETEQRHDAERDRYIQRMLQPVQRGKRRIRLPRCLDDRNGESRQDTGDRRMDPGQQDREPEQGKAGEIDRQRTRSEEHTSELQSLMRISYAVFCLKKKNI